MASALSALHFHNEEAAYAFVEQRVWPQGPVCPHCGGGPVCPHCGGVERIGKMGGKSTRVGTYKCYQCRKPFTVKIGTVFESSHVPLHIWLQAIYLMAGSKKGISSNQLHRTLGVTLKTAWFMSHRIREMMKSDSDRMMGGFDGEVEADETFIGNKKDATMRVAYHHKMKVFSLVERRTGVARSFVIEKLTTKEIGTIVDRNVAQQTRLMTDEAAHYRSIGPRFLTHDIVNHSAGEYVRGDKHTNTIEGFFSIFKRGMRGIYQHCAEKHLHRYLAEFDFRYTNRVACGVNDADRAESPSLVRSSASPTEGLVSEPDRHAKEEAGNDTRGTERGVSREGPRAYRRWRAKTHRGRRSIDRVVKRVVTRAKRHD